MARSGDWVTPRLWGEPWFEKPPLLYWMIAAGNLAGLGDDAAPRLPVALMSVAFLLFYYRVLRSQFGAHAAACSAAMLATCAGWVAFSQTGVPDLPMASAFSAAMLLGMRWLSTGDRRMTVAAAALLGLAVLAKGLVPLVLAIPLFFLSRKRWREWLRPLPAFTFLLIAIPWYLLCGLRHGAAFLQEFFGRHHFDRFTSGETLHPEPFWFYLPVLAAAVFPWSPLLAGLLRKHLYRDLPRRFLLLWLAFGLLFFSASAGKLPGYLLPLIPALTALLGLVLAEARKAEWYLGSSVLLLAAAPVAGHVLPQALAAGLSRSDIAGWNWRLAALCVALAVAVWILERSERRVAAGALTLAAAVAAILWLKAAVLPEIDRLATARPLWKQAAPRVSDVCVGDVPRSLRYGLNYYSDARLPDCGDDPRRWRIERTSGGAPVMTGGMR